MRRFALLLAASLLLAVLPLVPPVAAPRTTAQTLSGDCGGNPGALALRAWARLDPSLDPLRYVAGPGWVPYLNPVLGFGFYHPPDWTPLPLERLAPDRGGVRLRSPDGAAIFEVGTGIAVPAGTTGAAADLVLRGLLQGQPAVPLCSVEAFTPDLIPTSAALTTVQAGSVILSVEAFAMEVPGTGWAIVTYSAMGGPADRFGDLTERIFLPILFQFLPGGEGSLTPTPTPVG